MEPRLMKESLKDYTLLMRGRYSRRPGRQARSALLDEYCQSSGLERKHAIKVLRGQRRTCTDADACPGRCRRGRSSTYESSDIRVLKAVWLAAGQPCGKRLAGDMLKLWLASWCKHQEAALPAEQVRRIEGISAAQIDRELAPYRSAGRRRRIGSSALAAMQREVAVRCEPWTETAPGALEIDTVALCGGSMSGAIIWALDATDIHSGWTEVRAVWNRGAHATRERLGELEDALPFALRKLDFDNGTEFLNAHFISHFKAREPKVALSRSRPYRKNDNAHIEQKNYTHVRLLLGDDRFEHPELVEPLNAVLAQWSLWNNLYGAQRRLVSKERQADGKVKRRHEKQASTPCARLLARADLCPRQRTRLQALLEANDPIEMKARIESRLKAVYEQRAALQAAGEGETEETSSEALGEPAAAGLQPEEGAAARGKARLRCVRPVASGSLDSLHCGAPSRVAKSSAKGSCQTLRQSSKTPTLTVSPIVRHQATS